MNGYFSNLGTIINLTAVNRIVIERMGTDDTCPVKLNFCFSSGEKNSVMAVDVNTACDYLAYILNVSKTEAKTIVYSTPVPQNVQQSTENLGEHS